MSSGVLAYLNVVLGADHSQLSAALDDVSTKMANAGRRLQSAGRAMTTRVTLPLAAVGAASVKMASDAEEAGNKFDVVMGGAADRVRQQLQDLTATIPMTRTEMEALAAGIQDMLVPMGVARESAAGMSADMVELAGDLASFNNVRPQEVLEAMQSALAGASEPMRRYGVDTRVARLETIALENGLIEAGESMTNAAMAQAVMLAIQQDSTDAMGDAARTANSTANSMKFLMRDLRQLAITIGEILIPAVTPMIQALSSMLQWVQQLSPQTQKVVVAMAALAAAIGPVLIVMGTMMTAIGPLVTALGAITLAGTGVAALVVLAFVAIGKAAMAVVENWHVLKYETTRLVDAIREQLVGRFNAIVESVREKVEAVGGFFRDLYMRVVGGSYVPDMVDGIKRELGTRFGRIVGSVINNLGRMRQSFSDFVVSAIADIGRLIAKMLIFRFLASAIPGLGPLLGVMSAASGGGGFTGLPAPIPVTPFESRVSSGGDITIDPARLPAPVGPLQAARDSHWVDLISETIKEVRRNGGRI